jgi:predicted nucleic acid-binding protein
MRACPVDFDIEPDASRRALLTDRLEHTVRRCSDFAYCDIDENIMLRWRLLVAEARTVGHTYSQPDLLIAASALEYDLTLVTSNVKDFQKTGVALLNPWAAVDTTKP